MNLSLWLAVAAKVIKLLLSPEFTEVIKQTKELRTAIKIARADGHLAEQEIKDIVKEARDVADAIEKLCEEM